MAQKYKYSNWEFISDVWHYIRPYKSKFFIAAFFRLTSDIGRLSPAIATSRIVQILSRGDVQNSYVDLASTFLVWGLVTFYYSIFHNLSRYLGFQIAERASLDLYRDGLSHIFKLDLSWQEKEDSGNKMKRLDKSQDGMDLAIRRIFNVIIEVIVDTVGIVAIFFSLNIGISIALIFFIITFFIFGTYLLKRAIKQERLVNKAYENLSGLTFESLNNVHTIKSLGVDKGLVRIINAKIELLFLKIKKRIYYYQSQYGLLNSYDNLFRFSTVLYLAYGVLKGSVELSLLVLFVGLYQRVSASAGDLTDVTQELAKAKIWVSRAKHILNTSPKIENPKNSKKQKAYDPEWKEMSVRNVSFSYKKYTALDNVSFNVKRGQKVGIVGLSGAGKSTLFKLFLDLYENYYGEILIDEIPLKHISRQSYIDNVSVVLQDTELFDMSLKHNIEIAAVRRTKDPELLSKVIKMAHLEDVVDKLPHNINTIVGEKGIKLSGGQRQRLGLARALYRQPDILLLDEATSHLDAHSEKEIQKAILESMREFTTIVIAHRLSTIKAMDNIIVLEDGRVAEQGNFYELLPMKGVFAKMWQDQKI